MAHSTGTFRLRDHWSSVRQIFDLGPGVPTGINQLVVEVMVRHAVRSVMDLPDPSSEDGAPNFQTPQEVMDYLHENSDVLQPLEVPVPRIELAIGVGMICGLLVLHRNRSSLCNDEA